MTINTMTDSIMTLSKMRFIKQLIVNWLNSIQKNYTHIKDTQLNNIQQNDTHQNNPCLNDTLHNDTWQNNTQQKRVTWLINSSDQRCSQGLLSVILPNAIMHTVFLPKIIIKTIISEECRSAECHCTEKSAKIGIIGQCV